MGISVSSLNPEASAMFNAPNFSYANVSTSTGATVQASGYLVDANGNIQFPILGNVKAGGLTANQLRLKLTDSLLDRKLLADPIISIRYLNFKVTVLGEVEHPTVVNVLNEKITLLEALGLAGDITIYGKKDHVMVIREENGVKNIKYLNLNSSEIFTSPYYYLKSNDIVYVEPTKSRVSSTSRANQYLPIIISALSFLAIIADRIISKELNTFNLMEIIKKTTDEKKKDDLGQVIYKYIPYWPLFVILFLVAGVSSWLYLKIATPKYETKARLLIKDEMKGVEAKGLQELDLLSTNKTIENETEVIQSNNLLSQVVNHLNLYATLYETGQFHDLNAYTTAPVTVIAADPSKIKPSKDKIDFSFDKASGKVSVFGKEFSLQQWINSPYGVIQFVANPNYSHEPSPDSKLYFTLSDPKAVADHIS